MTPADASHVMVPPSARTIPLRILISVLLPEPFSPARAWTEPGASVIDASTSARGVAEGARPRSW